MRTPFMPQPFRWSCAALLFNVALGILILNPGALAIAETLQPPAGGTGAIRPGSRIVPKGPEYGPSATPQGETGAEARPIDASGATPIEGEGITIGPVEKAVLPEPIDSDGDGYYDYAEEQLGTDPYHAASRPDMPSAEANRVYYETYVSSVNAGQNKHWHMGKAYRKSGVQAASSSVGGAVKKGVAKVRNFAVKHPVITGAAAVGVVAGTVAIASSGGGGGGGGGGAVDANLAGTISGGWSGSLAGWGAIGGGFSFHISPNGAVSGRYGGDASGSINGTVAGGRLSASGGGSAGEATWQGQISRSGNTLTGSGTWSAPDASGRWSGTGPAETP